MVLNLDALDGIVETGIHPRPTTTFKALNAGFLDYHGGQYPAIQANFSGKIKNEGGLVKSQIVEALFNS